MIRINSRGDTIVEVLIAIAIVSTVLGGAYASAQRSLQAGQRSQERAEAMRVIEQQLELLNVSADQSAAVFSGGARFCLDTAGKYDLNGAPPASYTDDNYSLMPSGNYPAQCRVSYSNGAYFYYTSIERLADNTFTVRARWDGAGSLKQEALISYRVQP